LSENEIILNVHMEAAPGSEEELAEQLGALLEPTRQEPGCVAYELHRDPEHAGKFMFYERFKDQKAFDDHINSAHFIKFQNYRSTKSDPVAVANVTRWRRVD
jgi:quinol monooxygenase YgiN